MYAPHFGLKREPFSIAPDPRFLFMSEAHREALAHLLYGVSGGGGFVLLTGEIGAGKTTVCRCFLDQVPADCDVAYVFNPKLSVPELLQTVCDEFGIELAPGALSVKRYVDALNGFLLRAHAAGRHSVLIIDEAQSLSADLLEQLRLLTNLETAERKLLQIVLIGQPELRTLLARPELEQLAQRVIARYHLPALSQAETAMYLRHRLSVAGLSGEMPFDKAALKRLHDVCGGVPRRLNLLADRALLGAYAGGKTRIDRPIVERAAREVFGPDAAQPRHGHWGWSLGGAGALAAVLLVAAWTQGWKAPKTPAPMPVAGAASGALAPAVAAAATSSAAAAPTADAATLLDHAWRDEDEAWRVLALQWRLDLRHVEPCDAAARVQVYCFRSADGLGLVRSLDRPGLLTLHDAQGREAYALLVGLTADSATLNAGGTLLTLPLAALAMAWRGDYATFWRAPPGYREPLADSNALDDWMVHHLPAADGAPLKTRLLAFQVAHGLKADGLVGPLTLMQINRASGMAEPRLNPER